MSWKHWGPHFHTVSVNKKKTNKIITLLLKKKKKSKRTSTHKTILYETFLFGNLPCTCSCFRCVFLHVWQALAIKRGLSGVHLAAASAILLIDQRVAKAHCALLLGRSATPGSSNASQGHPARPLPGWAHLTPATEKRWQLRNQRTKHAR